MELFMDYLIAIQVRGYPLFGLTIPTVNTIIIFIIYIKKLQHLISARRCEMGSERLTCSKRLQLKSTDQFTSPVQQKNQG